MADAAVIAVGAVSAQGRGPAAYAVGNIGERAQRYIEADEPLRQAGLLRAHCARAVLPPPSARMPDRACQLLTDALQQLTAELDSGLPHWRDRRIRLALGTSAGGMLSMERFFLTRARHAAPPPDVQRASYFGPLREALAQQQLEERPLVQVQAACASSTIAIGLGLRWLDRGVCELVLAGGYDAVSVFVAAGFEALRATTQSRPQPFRMGRDGMALGEGAALVALARPGVCARVYAFVAGFGAGSDARHITAPDREGRGLVRAARAALQDAQLQAGEVGLVSAHATSTPYNDAAEAKAIAALCPQQPVVHPFKAQIGHTLGAAGALESLAAISCLQRQVLPAAAGEGAFDPAARVKLLSRTQACRVDTALKLSAAFGGVTAALVLRRAAVLRPPWRQARARRPVVLLGHVSVVDYNRERLVVQTGLTTQRLARIDELGRLALAACAHLFEDMPRPLWQGAGVVVGHALATLDTDERYNARRLSKGARWVDPRRFPATSPNAAAGQCAIAWRLTGPNFAVGASLNGGVEAIAAAAELVAAGDAPAMVVVAVDDVGPAAQAWLKAAAPGTTLARGATALLLASEGEGQQLGWAQLDDCLRGPQAEAGGQLGVLRWLRRVRAGR